MKCIILFITLIAASAALSACACSMDTTGGFDHGSTTMNEKPIYDPGTWPMFRLSI